MVKISFVLPKGKLAVADNGLAKGCVGGRRGRAQDGGRGGADVAALQERHRGASAGDHTQACIVSQEWNFIILFLVNFKERQSPGLAISRHGNLQEWQSPGMAISVSGNLKGWQSQGIAIVMKTHWK